MDLTAQVNSILQEYAEGVDKLVLEVEEDVSKEAIKRLKKTSPKASRNGGHRHYADDWKIDNRSKKQYAKMIIHNKQYQLTHLLENGHVVVNAKGSTGKRAAAHKHIEPVYEWAQQELVHQIEMKLGRM